MSCGLLILVNEAAEAVTAVDLVDLGWGATREWACGSACSTETAPAPEATFRTVHAFAILPLGRTTLAGPAKQPANAPRVSSRSSQMTPG
jgi:hypothetical protein